MILVANANATCDQFNSPETAGRLSISGLTEASGIARSMIRDDVWYTHNDSGGEPELFGFTTAGELVGRYPLGSVEAYDWEDIATGPCPDDQSKACIFVGDIGDNTHSRDSVFVYVFREELSGPGDLVGNYELHYEESPLHEGRYRNAEALMVHPVTGRLYVVSKSRRNQIVYRAPENMGEGVLSQIAVLSHLPQGSRINQITGGDFSPAGDSVVLRDYLRAYYWTIDAAAPEAHWLTDPMRVGLRLEPQGEAIGFSQAGDLYTISEGNSSAITRVGCP
jgi:hypothetical protein